MTVTVPSPYPYNFPIPPYPAQVEFMDRAASVLSAGGLGILELPTGGGKSLALLSACLDWVSKNRSPLLNTKLSKTLPDGEIPDWVRSHLQSQQQAAVAETEEAWAKQLSFRRERLRMADLIKSNKRVKSNQHPSGTRTDDLLLLTEDDHRRPSDVSVVNKDDSTRFGVRKYPQVIIASRTHSQLSQLVKEFRRSPWSSLGFKGVTLGSRQNLCVFSSEAREMTHEQVTDLCRQAVDSGVCEFKRNSSVVADHLLTDAPPLDIEEIRTLSTEASVRGCGYFGTREAVTEADVIFVPYASLLSTGTRDALDLEVDGNILVIDEAHNIIEATNASNTVSFTASQVAALRIHLKLYISEYGTKLSPQNLIHVKQLDVLLRKLSSLMTGGKHSAAGVAAQPEAAGASAAGLQAEVGLGLHAVSEIAHAVHASGPSGLLRVLQFLTESELPRKLRGFVLRKKESQSSAIYALQSFLAAITESRSIFDRILVEAERLSFVSIDADSRLAKIVAATHATLLVGGTMRPIAELAVVGKESGKKLDFFQGRHVVPPERVFVRALADEDLCFTFANIAAQGAAMWAKVARVVQTVCQSLDFGGVVVFVPSYDMLAKVKTAMDDAAASGLRCKVLFDGKTEETDSILGRFASIVSKQVCVLVSVVGGRLSEGIDFKDDLCRCVILVGLPYPNIKDPVLNEKMRYYDAKKLADPVTSISGQDFYEAKCIKAVNQSIGRAIRHKNDWAGIVLVDSRFARPNIQQNLSEWVRNAGVRSVNGVQQLGSEFAAFVRTMRT